MNNKISFFLNTKEVEANNNETIWDVSKREGIEIPHLCHSDKNVYKPDGNCRACVVEIQGEKTLTASCIAWQRTARSTSSCGVKYMETLRS